MNRKNYTKKVLIFILGSMGYLASGVLVACPTIEEVNITPTNYYLVKNFDERETHVMSTIGKRRNPNSPFNTNFQFGFSLENKNNNIKSKEYCIYLPDGIYSKSSMSSIIIAGDKWQRTLDGGDRILSFKSNDIEGTAPDLDVVTSWVYFSRNTTPYIGKLTALILINDVEGCPETFCYALLPLSVPPPSPKPD